MKLNLTILMMTPKQMNRRGIYNIAFAFLVFILIFLLMGCSSRKVNKSEVKEEVKTEQTVKEEVKTDSNTNTTIVDTSETTEIEIVPIDNSKPIEYNGHKVINGTLKLSKRKNAITTNSNEKVSQIEKKEVKAKANKVVKVKQKQTEAKRPFSWWWLILVVGVVIFIYRKYLRQWI